jgi:hypothetical protein
MNTEADASCQPWTTIHTPEGATYVPWTDGHAVGFRVSNPGEPDTYVYLYLNPSGESDDLTPNVFLYQGPDGDPSTDTPIIHSVVGETRLEVCLTDSDLRDLQAHATINTLDVNGEEIVLCGGDIAAHVPAIRDGHPVVVTHHERDLTLLLTAEGDRSVLMDGVSRSGGDAP